jgi:hypothetical protein
MAQSDSDTLAILTASRQAAAGRLLGRYKGVAGLAHPLPEVWASGCLPPYCCIRGVYRTILDLVVYGSVKEYYTLQTSGPESHPHSQYTSRPFCPRPSTTMDRRRNRGMGTQEKYFIYQLEKQDVRALSSEDVKSVYVGRKR